MRTDRHHQLQIIIEGKYNGKVLLGDGGICNKGLFRDGANAYQRNPSMATQS